MSINTHFIYKKSDIIPIQPISISPNKTLTQNFNEYGLTHNLFDPTKNSPPNEFLLKLKLRMSRYNNFDNLINA